MVGSLDKNVLYADIRMDLSVGGGSAEPHVAKLSAALLTLVLQCSGEELSTAS